MKDVCFGSSIRYDDGDKPSIAMNRSGKVVEVHDNGGTINPNVWYHVGAYYKATVDWVTHNKCDNGIRPSVAINNNDVVVEVHQPSEVKHWIWYWVGKIKDDYSFEKKSHAQLDKGKKASVAINDNNEVVEVHRSSGVKDYLWYWLGKVKGDFSIEKKGHGRYGSGDNPSVAINNKGIVVEVHDSGGWGLWYHVGRIRGDSIDWGPSTKYDRGRDPSVALTDDGFVIEVHTDELGAHLWCRVGQINGNAISWSRNAFPLGSGRSPSVACSGRFAIQTHLEGRSLCFSNSIIADRASWMQDNLALLGDKSLKQLMLPASHDAGMYLSGFLDKDFGKTQTLDLYDQLSNGIRYFDLRPLYKNNELYIYHGSITGPKLSDVLDQIKKFMEEGHHELVILKFSHYGAFNLHIYPKLVDEIDHKLGNWLYSTPLALSGGKRLAERPLSDYISTTGAILVVCDCDKDKDRCNLDYPLQHPQPGIWVYRDRDMAPEKDELRVYDDYTGTEKYETMKADQLRKFDNFNDKDPHCDLFLLSWTLTPGGFPHIPFVPSLCKPANRRLGADMAHLVPNKYGCIPNLIYVDCVESARVTDVALFQNLADQFHFKTPAPLKAPLQNPEQS